MKTVKIVFNEPDQNGDVYQRDSFSEQSLINMKKDDHIIDYELTDRYLSITTEV